MFSKIVNYFKQRRSMLELENLSDDMLKDIGINRSEIYYLIRNPNNKKVA